MSDWGRALRLIASNIEDAYDDLKLRLREKLGIGPVSVLPFMGHGRTDRVCLRGRVVANRSVVPAEDNDSVWENLLNMYRRFHTQEIPHAEVQITLGDLTRTVRANVEGCFEVTLDIPDGAIARPGWHKADILAPEYPDQEGARTQARVLVPPDDAQFGIISDLDDTVIRTDVFDLVKVARNTFLRNAHTRLPFAGVAAFYRALQVGRPSTQNPIYYVSNSPWNLYDLLVDFFEVRSIPLGPLFLTNLGLTDDHWLRKDPYQHKLGSIQHLLDTYPSLPFVLLGDSGEHDPEIYLEAVRRNPDRITAIYIRNVLPGQRGEEVQGIADKTREAGAEMLLVTDTVEAAEHAAAHGLIYPELLPIIREERAEDAEAAGALEALINELTPSRG